MSVEHNFIMRMKNITTFRECFLGTIWHTQKKGNKKEKWKKRTFELNEMKN